MTFPCCVKAKIVFTFTFSLFVILQCFPSPFHVTPPQQTLRNFSNEANVNHVNYNIEINSCIIVPILLSRIALFTLLGLVLKPMQSYEICYLQHQIKRIEEKNPITDSYQNVLPYLSVIMLGLFLSECEKEQILLNIIYANLNFGCVVSLVLKVRKIIAGTIYVLLFICLFSIAVTPATSTLCILVFQIGCIMVANVSHYIIK